MPRKKKDEADSKLILVEKHPLLVPTEEASRIAKNSAEVLPMKPSETFNF
jgi:hypothetical protein